MILFSCSKGHIGASLIPRSVFAAVPRMPAPPQRPLAPSRTVIQTALLNASVFPRTLAMTPKSKMVKNLEQADQDLDVPEDAVDRYLIIINNCPCTV